jgi:hypothetical protein
MQSKLNPLWTQLNRIACHSVRQLQPALENSQRSETGVKIQTKTNVHVYKGNTETLLPCLNYHQYPQSDSLIFQRTSGSQSMIFVQHSISLVLIHRPVAMYSSTQRH